MILSTSYNIDELCLVEDRIEKNQDFITFVELVKERMGKKRIGVGKSFQDNTFYLLVRKSHYNMYLQRNCSQILISFSDNKMYWSRLYDCFENTKQLRNGFWVYQLTDEQARRLMQIAKDYGVFSY